MSRRPEPTPGERALRARIAANDRAASTAGADMVSAARAAFDKKFLDQVDPDRILNERERTRRAKAARKAHMARLSLAKLQVDRRRSLRVRNVL